MKIAPASSDDLGAIRDLLHAAKLPYTGVTLSSVSNFLVAKNDQGQIVAAIEVDPYNDDGMLRYLAVDQDHHTSGVHELIIAAAESHAINLGLERLYILAHTSDRFFHQRGYASIDKADIPLPIAETPEFRAFHTDTTECLSLALNA